MTIATAGACTCVRRLSASLTQPPPSRQVHIHGTDAAAMLESLVVADVAGLAPGSGTLSLFTTETGGIADDLIVSRTAEGPLYVVSNAGCRDKDREMMERRAAEWRDKVGRAGSAAGCGRAG